MSENNFDVIVIGAGPAGYVAAIRCSQLGLKTACIDKRLDDDDRPVFGGTCLNVGCIPSKALLEVSHNYLNTKNNLSSQGVSVKGVEFNLKKVMEYKDSVVKKLTSGVASLLKMNKVSIISGIAKVMKDNVVQITSSAGEVTSYNAKNIIIATGSSPVEIPVAKFNNKTIVDSTGALSFDSVPKRLGVIGAGVIGLELGSVWARFGSDVTIMEASDTFLAMADKQIAQDSKKYFEKEGIKISLGTKVMLAEAIKNQVRVKYEKDGQETEEIFDKVVVAVGRIPNTKNIVDESVGLNINNRGFIEVDIHCQTNLPGIFAIGDIVRGPMLAHKGSEEGIMVAERIVGKPAEVNYDIIPSVIYTSPEIAWVGKTEEQLNDEGIPYTTGVFPMSANGRALAHGDGRGILKVISDKQTDTILGVHICATDAGEMIAQAVISMEFKATAEDIGMTMFAHPTVSEVFHEAALGVHGHAIHMLNRKK